MTEKNLIRIALESRLRDPLMHRPSEIIEAEAKGAQAHIRRRRFASVGIAAAAALLVGASVFGFSRLSKIEREDPAADSSSSDSSEAEEKDTGEVILLCDLTGKTEDESIELVRSPKNLRGATVKIYDQSVQYEGRALINDYCSNKVIKVFAADVTGDGYADICVETKPDYSCEESAVYLFDVHNDKGLFYYVPDTLSFSLKKENEKLMLGMQSPADSKADYVTADFKIPERYTQAQKDWLRSLTAEIRTAKGAAFSYIAKPSGEGTSNLGDGIYYDSEIRMSCDLTGEGAADPLSAVLWGKDGSVGFEPETENEPLPISMVNWSDELYSDRSYYAMLNANIGTTVEEAICTLSIRDTVSEGRLLTAEVRNEYGVIYSAGYRCSAAAAPLRQALDDTAGGKLTKNDYSSMAVNNYHCEDINALGNTSSAQRMLISQNGRYAVGYHFESSEGVNALVVDSVQPKWVEGKIYLSDGGTDTALDITGEKSEGKMISIPVSGGALNSGITVRFSIENEDYSDYATDFYTFGDSGYKKEFVYLADFSDSTKVTRLDSGEQIRFERRLDALPGAVVSITDSSVTVTDPVGGMHTVADGQRVLRVFASDLNGDGRPEIIAEVCRDDRETDGDVIVFEPVSEEVTSVSEAFYSGNALWLDSVRTYLSVMRKDDSETYPHTIAQDVPLKTIYSVVYALGIDDDVLNKLDELEKTAADDPAAVRYTLCSYDDSTVTGSQSYEGVLYELHDIAEEIRGAINSGEFSALALEGIEYADMSGGVRFSCEIKYDENESPGTVLSLDVFNDGTVYIMSRDSFISDLEMIMIVKLSEERSEALSKLIYDNDIVLKNITKDGNAHTPSAYIKSKEELEGTGFELKDKDGFLKLKGRAEFDFRSKTAEIYTDKFETAEGVSVEQSEISIEMWSSDDMAVEVSKKLKEPPQNGTSVKLDYSNETEGDGTLLSGYIFYTFKLRLPDGTEREIVRSVYCMLVKEEDQNGPIPNGRD